MKHFENYDLLEGFEDSAVMMIEMRPLWHGDGAQHSPHPQCIYTGPLSGGGRRLQALQVTEREIINGKMKKIWKDEKKILWLTIELINGSH